MYGYKILLYGLSERKRCRDGDRFSLSGKGDVARFSRQVPELRREGHMFGRFLKVADACDHCGEELFHQRADDFPAYLVMVVVGHLVVPAILVVETAYAPPVWLQLAAWLPVTLFASLALLQPTKGAIVGLQWQIGMHGFEASKLRREAGQLAPVLVKAPRAA